MLGVRSGEVRVGGGVAVGDLAPTIFAAPPLFGRAAADLINWNSIKEAFEVTQDKDPLYR